MRATLTLSILALAAVMGGCDAPMSTVDAGIDARADATSLTDSRSTSDTPTNETGADVSSPFDGASGIGNGTCAETGSFCLANDQCCSGLCNATTMWSGGGICEVRQADSGTGFSGDAGSDDGGDCLHPCHCPSNQHCCLVTSATATCGVSLECSVIEGCL